MRPFRHNRLDLLEKRLKAAQADGSGVLVVVDGVYSMEGDVAPLPEIVALCQAVRRAADGRRGARLRRARRPRRRHLRAVRRRGRGRSADGDLLQVAGLLRRRDRRLRRGDRVPADRLAPVHLHRLGRARGGRGDARRGADRRSDEGRELFAKVLANAAYLRRGLAELGYWVLPPAHMADGTEIVTPVVPVVVGDDWKAVFLWKALYEAGVFVNVAIHPAVPPAGALLRTSVMATHDRDRARRGARDLQDGQAGLRGRARPAADRRLTPHDRARSAAPRRILAGVGQAAKQRRAVTEKTRYEHTVRICDLAVTVSGAVAWPSVRRGS